MIGILMLMILLMILEGIYWFRGHRSLLGIQTWVNASAFKKQRGELLRAGLIQGFSWSLMYTERAHSSLFKTRNMLDIIQCLCKAPWPQLLSSPLSIFYPSHPLALSMKNDLPVQVSAVSWGKTIEQRSGEYWTEEHNNYGEARR